MSSFMNGVGLSRDKMRWYEVLYPFVERVGGLILGIESVFREEGAAATAGEGEFVGERGVV
jgi:hypothetical protein